MLSQTTAGLSSRPTPPPTTLTTTKTTSSEADTSGGTDSGYASQATTPGKGPSEASSDSTFVHKVVLPTPRFFQRKVTRLQAFDSEIPEAVRNRFCDLKELFDKPLYEYLSKERVSVGSIAMRLKVLGKTEETAKPWVVILCDPSISKLVKQYFNQPQVKEQFQTCHPDPELPSLDILIHDKPPKLRAVVEFDGVDEYINANTNDTLCGTLIKASSSNDCNVATLGGVVKVCYASEKSMLYGMTVGHLFKNHRSETPISTLFSVQGDSMSETADDENSNADMTEEFILDMDFEEGDATVTQPEAPAGPAKNSHWSRLGSGIVPVSAQCAPVAHRNLDWALVDFEDKARYKPNLLPISYGTPSAELRQLSNSTTYISEKKVVVVSGRNELKHGKLSSFTSFLLLAPGSTILQTYTLTLTDGSHIRDGDSGSWVVDDSTNEVYGYLVASDVFQDGYVIPLSASLQDMRTELAAKSVCLPTTEEVYLWHASQWHGKDAIHILTPPPQSLLSAISSQWSQSSTQNFRETDQSTPETFLTDYIAEINGNLPMGGLDTNVDKSKWLHSKGSENPGGSRSTDHSGHVTEVNPLTYALLKTTEVINNDLVPPSAHHRLSESSLPKQRRRFRSVRHVLTRLFGRRQEDAEASTATREILPKPTLLKRQIDPPSPRFQDSGYSTMHSTPMPSTTGSPSHDAMPSTTGPPSLERT